MLRYTSKLKWFPIIQVISLLPATVDRIVDVATGNEYFPLALFRIMFDSLTGLFFTLVYGLNPSVNRAIRDCLCKIFGIRQSIDEGNYSSNNSNFSNRSLSYLDEQITTEMQEKI